MTNIYILETRNIGMYQSYQSISISLYAMFTTENKYGCWTKNWNHTTMHKCQYCGPVEIEDVFLSWIHMQRMASEIKHLLMDKIMPTSLSTEPNGKESLVTIPLQNLHIIYLLFPFLGL